MDLELHNQHVVVTGGSKGIGLACAQGFWAEGARVTLMARTQADLDTARQQSIAAGVDLEHIHAISVDLRDADAALNALNLAEQHFGPVDVLVACAGAAQRVPVDELTPQSWHESMQAKFFSYVHIIDPCIKRMGLRGRGAIVNIIGNGGKVASPIHLSGGAANAALMLATAGWANAYAARGVRVNGINPGQTLTGRLQGRMKAISQHEKISVEQALKQSSAELPMGRFAEPKEVADAVLYLASARASYVTGTLLSMDGALTPLI